MNEERDAPTWPHDVRTLAVDVGGSGIKASVLDSAGVLLVERVRMDTPYPCPPERLVASILELISTLPRAHRASVGFPGLVRDGRVIEVPSLSRASYDGEADPTLVARWHGFDLGHELALALDIPTLVVNDADMQGAAVVHGQGVEFVMTLGTGVGTALFSEGQLLPHFELSHGPFRKGMTTDIALGEARRQEIGTKHWVPEVRQAIENFHAMLWFDRIYVGGGNAKRLDTADVGPKGIIVPNTAGILGGVRIWQMAGGL